MGTELVRFLCVGALLLAVVAAVPVSVCAVEVQDGPFTATLTQSNSSATSSDMSRPTESTRSNIDVGWQFAFLTAIVVVLGVLSLYTFGPFRTRLVYPLVYHTLLSLGSNVSKNPKRASIMRTLGRIEELDGPTLMKATKLSKEGLEYHIFVLSESGLINSDLHNGTVHYSLAAKK